MNFLLSISELKFLLKNLHQSNLIENLEKAKHNGEYLAKGRYATGRYSLKFSEKQIDTIQEELSVLLTEKGIGDDGEPNAIGLLIENLIDKFDGKN